MQQKKTIPYLTFAQVVSAVAVVFLHTNGCFWSFSTERYWATANVIESLCYFAVPVFFMITGITLIDYPDRYDLRAYFRKRAEKTLWPFAAWSMIALALSLLRGGTALSELTPRFVISGVLGARFVPIYWFFPALFSLYLSMPLFAAVSKERRRRVFTYLLCAGILCNTIIPFVIRVFSLDFSWPIQVGAAAGYLIFIPGGVLLHENPPGRKARLILYALGLAGLLAQILGTYRLSMAAGEIVQTYKGYTNLPGLLYSFAMFALLQHLGTLWMERPVGAWIRRVGKYTFPVYLLHWFVMEGMVRLFSIPTVSLWYRLGAPFVIVPAVMAVTWVLRKIPGVRTLVP